MVGKSMMTAESRSTGHEPANLGPDETTRLDPGMCFSNEPGLYLPSQFGVRLKGCFHRAEAGPVRSGPARRRRAWSGPA